MNPFFDNVHYSELADFFYAWQQCGEAVLSDRNLSTRSPLEVQDADAARFAEKLEAVLGECCRVLKDDGLLVFTYHHSRNDGWWSLAKAILGAGFLVTNSQPVKGELSVATPKAQAKEPIQLDIIVVCKKRSNYRQVVPETTSEAIESARVKILRLRQHGFRLSRNDRKIVLDGQLLTTVRATSDLDGVRELVERELDRIEPEEAVLPREPRQRLLF